MWLLKALIEDACLASVERLFQHCEPLNEKHFCPLADLFKGSLKSVPNGNFHFPHDNYVSPL